MVLNSFIQNVPFSLVSFSASPITWSTFSWFISIWLPESWIIWTSVVYSIIPFRFFFSPISGFLHFIVTWFVITWSFAPWFFVTWSWRLWWNFFDRRNFFGRWWPFTWLFTFWAYLILEFIKSNASQKDIKLTIGIHLSKIIPLRGWTFSRMTF